jgi:hypothetical protein
MVWVKKWVQTESFFEDHVFEDQDRILGLLEPP